MSNNPSRCVHSAQYSLAEVRDLNLDQARKTLIQSTKLLCNHLRLDSILLSLLSDGALKPDDVTKIQLKATDSEKVKALLDILARSPVSSYQVFMKELKKERKDLYEKVKAIEEEKSDSSDVFDLACLQEELIHFYKTMMCRVTLLPWFDEENRDMDDIYVSLQLENKSKEVLDTNEDLVTIKMPSGIFAKRVFVKGTVGSGKSTLMAKLAYTWAQRNPSSPLYQYDLVFFLSFREIQKGCSVTDAIFQQILPDNTIISEIALNKFISSNRNVLFLIDGFDEYFADNVNIVQGEIDAMLNFQTFREAHVIVTSRPNKQIGKHQSLYESVILNGFSSENVKLYLNKFFYNNSELVEGLNKKLSESGNLKNLSHIPVMLMLMCLLWEDSQALPNTQSELYAEFVEFLWKKFCHRCNVRSPNDNLENFLDSLGKVAFDGLMSNSDISHEKLVFCEADFLEDFKKGCQVGLLTKERLRSKLRVTSAITFLHKSFQEYCASHYLASLPDDQFYIVLQRTDTIGRVKNKLEILKFLCGIHDTDRVTNMIHHVIQVYLEEIDTDDVLSAEDIAPVLIMLLESGFPSGNVPLTESLRSLLSTCRGLKIDGWQPHWNRFVNSPLASTLNLVKSFFFSPHLLDMVSDTLFHMLNVENVWISNSDLGNMNKLGSCISRLKHLSTFCFFGPVCAALFRGLLDMTPMIHPMSDNGVFQLERIAFAYLSCDSDILCHLLAKQHQLQKLSLQVIDLKDGNMGSILDAIKAPLHELSIDAMHVGSDVIHIQHIIPHLHCLKLTSTYLEENDSLKLGDFLPDAKHLSSLDLSNNTVGKAVSKLGYVLPQLTVLNLSHADLDRDDISTLSDSIKEAKCLSELDMSFNNVGKAIQIIGCVIPQICKLHLSDAHLDKDDTLSDFMKEAKCLSDLCLSGNDVGNSVCKLGCVIPQLSVLLLSRAHLLEDDMSTLSEFIKEAKCLSVLDLSGNNMANAGGIRLYESLKSCPNLKQVWLTDTFIEEVVSDVEALERSSSDLEVHIGSSEWPS